MPLPIFLTPRAVRVTWIFWGVILLLGSAVVVCHPECEQANDAYARGAARWLAGNDLYAEGGTGFIYLPQSAVLYVPFALLPRAGEHILWRIVTIGLFAAGTCRLCRMAEEETGFEFFPLVSFLVLPKLWACVIHGQATAAMAGLSMMALGEIHRRRWGLAAALLIAALAFKPLALVLVLLAAALYRPLAGRLALGMVLLFAAPYLTQNPGYVTEQYLSSIGMLDKAATMGQTNDWPHLFSLASLLGVEVAAPWQTVLRAAAALATLALCMSTSKSKIPDPKSEISIPPLLTLYALATVYLLLFNPRTENNSYLLLSPVMAVFGLRALFIEGQMLRAAWLFAGAIAIFAGHEICRSLTPQVGFVWVSPLVCLLFAADLIRSVLWPAAKLPPEHSSSNADPSHPQGRGGAASLGNWPRKRETADEADERGWARSP